MRVGPMELVHLSCVSLCREDGLLNADRWRWFPTRLGGTSHRNVSKCRPDCTAPLPED